jgi:amino acid adenylation domain-containing protein
MQTTRNEETMLSEGPVRNTPRERELCIHETFERQALKTPDAIAVSCGNEKLTYAELNRRADQLAACLATLGVRPEVPVALYLERSLEMVIAILGVLKAGAPYVPVDLAYPKDRFSFMLEDTNAPILLTQKKLLGTIPPTKAQILCMEDLRAIPPSRPYATPSLAEPANAAYIIYTSGSTGKPKGVVVTHNNVVRLLKQTEHWYHFNSSDVWSLFHSYAFDVSVFELWGALFYGGRLVVVPYLVSRSPHDFYQLLACEKVTVLSQTPSAFRQLIWAEATAEKKLDLALRYVICAGEALELQSLKPWFDRHGDAKPEVVNMYGITEITVHATYRVIRQADLTSGVGSVIGVPIPDLQIHLLDEELKPVPSGVPGEICVGGAGVARGYLNRPELTSKRFIADPFSSDPGAKLYRSGDLAQYSAQGELEYLGRMDHQVKIRGFRVELGEIESALNRHPAIRESVVIAQPDSNGTKRLIAYVALNSECKNGRPCLVGPTVTELRAHLEQTVPDYMVPGAFVFLDSLPLTTNGKVDRRALSAPDGARPELKADFVPPRDAAERTLTQIWSDVLEIEKIGVHDNFFELGGDSIRSIAILSKAQKKGLNFSLQQIFKHPTIASLISSTSSFADPQEGKENSSAPSADLPERRPFGLISSEDRSKLPADAQDAYPLTRLQLGMFFHNELNPVSAIYHDIFSFRIQADFDREKLQLALDRLLTRHPMLRTSFHLAGFSEPLQIVHASAEAPIMVQDLGHHTPEIQHEFLVEWVEAEKRRPFERASAPLVRFHVLLLGQGSFQFIFSFHHVCLDGWSLAAVMTEIFQDYASLLQGVEQPFESPRIAYRDFVALEQQAVASEECRRFWTESLRGAALAPMPRWPKSCCAGGHEQARGPELQIESEVFQGLKRLAQAAGVPLKTVLLAAHLRVISALTGQTDIVSGLLSNGRPEAIDGEKLVGLFLNTLPVRLQLEGGSWLELIKQTFAAEQNLIPYRRFPLAEIQKLNGGRPSFEAAFDFVHFHVYRNLQGTQRLDLAEGHYFEANNLTAFTTFMLDVTSTQLQMHIDYDPDVLARKQVEEFSNYYAGALRAMAADPNSRYESFSPLSAAEQQRLLNEWNDTESDYPRTKAIHELFEGRVSEKPESIALIFGDEKLTYRELNDRANVIAEHLRQASSDSPPLIAICLERSSGMVESLLGVLKAGGTYVPLDPGLPRERQAFMLQDSNAAILITERKLLPGLPNTRAKVLCVEDLLLQHPPSRRSSRGSLEAISSSRLAYIIYTSGSTGQPKGVQITHRSVVNLLCSAAKTSGITAADNLLAVTTLSFDIAGLELFMPLILGGQVTLASREQAADGTQLGAFIESAQPTVMQATPSTWKLLIESGWQGRKQLKVFCGGEALTRSLADELLNRVREVWNFYGPTETTIWSTAGKVQPGTSISIGRPLANTQLYILDPRLNLLPVGAIGELHIGGDGVALGYLNRPELTAQRFIRDPFSNDPSRRLYKTGDLARYLPDGQVECLGRIDHQVKIRGFRIELGEVETILRLHPAIADAVVTAPENAFGEKRLAAYVVSRNGPPSTSDLREFMETRLPSYMVPGSYTLLSRLPLTANGKIDLRQLPAPEAVSLPPQKYVPPRNEDEQRLADIWKEVLTLNQVGIEDNFFELGGDSLSATRVFARINRAFSANISLREIFEHPSIASLASVVAAHKGSATSPISVIPRLPRRTVSRGSLPAV